MESARLSKETVDREEWITTPQTVNAFYMPSFNSVNFPAAFLQAPIYDPEASYEENLGGIGTVIGHEVTHAFDSGGAQYDENGNIADWWTQGRQGSFLGGWAEADMQWAVGAGILSGKGDGRLDPRQRHRGETAAMLQRFLEK